MYHYTILLYLSLVATLGAFACGMVLAWPAAALPDLGMHGFIFIHLQFVDIDLNLTRAFTCVHVKSTKMIDFYL
mgnify:CR=1 FL=1